MAVIVGNNFRLAKLPEKTLEPDVCIIGSGAGGATLAGILSENKCAEPNCGVPKYTYIETREQSELMKIKSTHSFFQKNEQNETHEDKIEETHSDKSKYNHEFKQEEGTKELDVLLLERGSFYTKEEFTQEEGEMFPKLYYNAGFQVTLPVGVTVVQGNCVGGSTVINDAVCMDPPEAVLKDWENKIGEEFCAKKLKEKYVKEVRNIISAECIKDIDLNLNQLMFQKGCKELGWESTPNDRNCKDCKLCGLCHIGCSYETKQSMLVTHIKDMKNRKNAHIFANCEVKELKFSSDDKNKLEEVAAEITEISTIKPPVNNDQDKNRIPEIHVRIEGIKNDKTKIDRPIQVTSTKITVKNDDDEEQYEEHQASNKKLVAAIEKFKKEHKIEISEGRAGFWVKLGNSLATYKPKIKLSEEDIKKITYTVVVKVEITIKPKILIVSAGTIASSEILLRSKVNNSQIGKNVTLHPTPGVIGEFDQEINAHNGVTMGIHCSRFSEASGQKVVRKKDTGYYLIESSFISPFQFSQTITPILRLHKELMGNYQNYTMAGILVKDEPKKAVISLDPFLKAKLEYELSDKDKNALINGMKDTARIFLSAGAKRVFTTHKKFTSVSQDDLPDLEKIKEAGNDVEKIYLGSAHPQGGNCMGKDPENSVVDYNCKVHGYKNLYVCDASIHPTAVGVNPQITIMALAARLAEHILKNREEILVT